MSDRYQIISAVSSGGAGTLYRGWDKHQNRDVSIQRIAVTGEAAQDVLRQARTLYGLRHPNIVTVYEYGSDDEGVYLVREMIKGKTLDALVTQRPLNEQEFADLVRQTLEALQEIHTSGLVHGNLQPGTLMVPWNSQNTFGIKISDFSLGAPLDPAAPRSVESEHFLAPEQFGNAAVTLRADLYSLGAILYFCLTQQHPFQGSHSAEVVVAHLYHRFIPLAELRPDLSRPFCSWVERLMKQSPADRPASAEEALQMFRLIPEEEVVVAAPLIEDEPAVAPVLEEDEEAPLAAVPDDAALEVPSEPEPQPAPLPPAETEPESEPPAPLEEAPVAPSAETPPQVRSAVAVAMSAPEPAYAPLPALKEPRRKTSATHLIIMAFAAILIGILALVSVLKYTSQDERQQRLAELSEAENPQGSDLDVRMLLDFLEERGHRDTAAKVLAQLQGGNYIDSMLVQHLSRARAFDASVKVVEVIGQRDIQSAFTEILPFTRNPSGEMRRAAWKTLSRITADNDIPRLIAAIDTANPADTEAIQDSVVAALESSADRTAASEAARHGYESAKNPATRAILLNVLTRVGGGPETLALITRAIADPAEDVRRAAIIVLAQYPTHDPLAAISARFPEEPDSSCRAYLLAAAKEVVSRPGSHSQEALARMAQSLYANAKAESERDRALSVISQVIAPATVTFYENYAKQDDPRLRREALSLAAAYRRRLEQVVSVAPGAEATAAPAAVADFTLGGAIALENGVLVNWTSDTDWASWLIQFPSNGVYEIIVYQAHTGDTTGTYEVLVAGQTQLTASVKTSGPADFKGFIVGEFTITEPGTYRVLLRPKKIPAGGELMRLQKLAIKPL